MEETPLYSRCLSRLQKLCSKAEYCRSTVYAKALKALDGDGEAAARLVESLVQERYVDDTRYAAAFAREKASLQGWGPVKIRFQLRAKGISEADIGTALQEVDASRASDRLEKLLQGKLRTLEEDPQRKLKLIRFALSRGYEYSDVEAALSRIL